MSEMTHAEAEAIVAESEKQELRHLSPDEMPAALQLSNKLSAFVDWIGRFGSWFIIPLVLLTVFDVLLRKTGEVQL